MISLQLLLIIIPNEKSGIYMVTYVYFSSLIYGTCAFCTRDIIGVVYLYPNADLTDDEEEAQRRLCQ